MSAKPPVEAPVPNVGAARAGSAPVGALGAIGPRWLIVALIGHALLTTVVARVTLRHFPNSGDEYAYLLSAELFSEGKLHLPSPPLREFFDVSHVVNDGRYYGKYAPGWPAVLALAVLLGQPWLANLLIGVAILALTFVLARRHYGARTANIAMVLGFACPSMVFNDASLFSHPLCLLALTGATLAWFECLDRPCARLPFIVLGAAAGLAFVTRPFTTVVAVGCFAVSAAVHRAPRTPSFWRNILILSVGGALIFVIPFLCYNRAQTGAWLLQPFELYDPGDHLGFHRGARTALARLRTHGSGRIVHLCGWTGMVPLLAAAGLLLHRRHLDAKILALALLPVALTMAFFFYWGDGWFQYGPRYLHESTFALVVLAAVAVARLRAWAPIAIAAVLALQGAKLVQAHRFYSTQVTERLALDHSLKDARLEHALVFLRTGAGSMAARDLARNGTGFDGPVLLVQDRGLADQGLVHQYPDRKLLVFAYDPSEHRGKLIPFERAQDHRSVVQHLRAFSAAFAAAPRFLK